MSSTAVSVDIDQQLMVDAVKQVVQKGLADGVGSWETQRLITDAVKAAVDTHDLPAMIQTALEGRLVTEADAIVSSVVEDAMPMMQEAFRLAISGAMRAMIYGIVLGVPDGSSYMGDREKAAWTEAQRIIGQVSA